MNSEPRSSWSKDWLDTTRLTGPQNLANMRRTSTVIAQQYLLQMHNNKMAELKNECYSDGAQDLQWCNSMANIKICKRHFELGFSEILEFPIFYFTNLGQGRGVQHSQWCQLMANITTIKAKISRFYAFLRSHRYQYISVSNVWLWNLRSNSPSTTFLVVPFVGQHQPLWKSLTRILRLIVSEILTFKNINFNNFGQGRKPHHAQWCHPITLYQHQYKSQSAFLR